MKNLIISIFLLILLFNVEGQNTNTLYGMTTTTIQVVRAISPDGRYVTGQALTAPRQAFTWDITSGNVIVNLGGSTVGALSEGYDVTNNNRVAGDFADPELLFEGEPIRSAGYWENGTWTGLGLGLAAGNPPTSLSGGSHATCITADGNTIAGYCQTFIDGTARVYPYSWTYNDESASWNGDVWEDPENIYQGSGIIAISGDGSVAAGWTNLGFAARVGILWTSKDEYQLFGQGTQYDYSEFICLSRNGKYAGFKHNLTVGVYDIENDEYYYMPEGIIVNAISDNGFAIGAYLNSWDAPKGFIWNKALGFMEFNEFRLTYFPDITFAMGILNAFNPTTLNAYLLNAISADGQSITLFAGNRAFVIKLANPIVVVPYPKNLTATVSRIDRNIAELTWEEPEAWTDELEHYVVYRDNVEIAIVEAGTLAFTDTDVEAGYKNYSVKAIYENSESRKSDIAVATIVDNYNIPFFEDFNSESLATNYWTRDDNPFIASWEAVPQCGVEAKSAGARLQIKHTLDAPFSASLISKPLDCSETENVYITYMLYSLYAIDDFFTKDSLFVDVSTDGITWTNVSKYECQKLTGWKTEIADISNIAVGELINIRIRVEGENLSSNAKWYFFDNIGVLATLPEGNEPQNVIGKESLSKLEVAWQNSEGLYGLSYQQTPIRYAFGNEGDNMIVAQHFDAEQLAVYDGLSLVSISGYIAQNISSPLVPTTLKLAVFADGQRVISQDIEEFTSNAWNTFVLTTPFLLNTVQNNLKIGIEVVTHDVEQLPIGADESGRGVAGKGDLYSTDGGTTWEALSDLNNSNYNRNWCVVGNVAHELNPAERDANIMGYNLYLDGEKINDDLIFGQSFKVDNLEGCYTVRSFSLTDGISGVSDPYCFVPEIPYFTVTVSAANGGFVEIVGYEHTTVLLEAGTYITMKATADEGKKFLVWKINGEEVAGAEAEYSFTVTADIALVAHFINTNTINTQELVQFSIFPNPVNNGVLNIARSTNGSAQMEIYNNMGARVMTQQLRATETNVAINISSLSSGVYLIRLIEGENSAVHRFVKE